MPEIVKPLNKQMKIYMTLVWVMKFLYEPKSTANKTNIRQSRAN